MEDNNPFDQWLNDNIQPGDSAISPFPNERFYDRNVPGTAQRIQAFNNRSSYVVKNEIFKTKQKLATIPNKVNNTLAHKELFIDLIINMGNENEFTPDMWETYSDYNRDLESANQRHAYLLNKETKLQMKIKMLEKEL